MPWWCLGPVEQGRQSQQKSANSSRNSCVSCYPTRSNKHLLRVGPRFAWAGGTFFPVVLLCQFLVLAGNRFWLYILQCTWSSIQLWCCVSFFGSGGKQFLVLRSYLVYNTVVWLCLLFCCGGKVNFVRMNTLQSQSFLKIIENFLCKKNDPL